MVWRLSLMRLAVSLVLTVLGVATGLAHALQPEDLYSGRSVSIADLSPDGRYLLYTLTAFDRELGRNQTTLLRRDLDTGEETVLLGPGDQGRGAVWRPDRGAIAYVRDEEAGAHVWLVDPDGTNPRRLSRGPHTYGELVWAPDGKAIAYLSNAPVGESLVRPGEVVVAEHIGYRHLGDGYRKGELQQLFLLDVASGDHRRLVEAPLDIRSVDWAPDAKTLVFEAKRLADLGVNLNSDLWVVLRDGGEPVQLTWNPGPDTSPQWREDGAIVYLRHPDPLCESAARRIAVLRDRERGDRGEIEEHGCGLDNLIWQHFAGGDYFTAFVHGSIDLYQTDGLHPLTPGGWDFWEVRVGRNTSGGVGRGVSGGADVGVGGGASVGRAVLSGSSQTIRSAICVLPLPASGEAPATNGGLQVLVDPNEEWAREVKLYEPQSFQIEVEGRTIHGWYFLPDGIELGEPVPTVLSIHGGPEWMYGGYFLPEFHILPENGYAVLIANPTGSTGYGMAFQQAIRGDWVGAPARELLACIDWAVGQGWADPERLAVMGGSYGGHLAAALTTQTQRFRAAAIDRMTCDLVAMWGTTDEKWFPEWEFFGRPWEEPARDYYYRNSPSNFADRVRTPTLVSHGLKDYRCLISQAETWFSILKANNVPVRFLRFANEGHGIRGTENLVFYQRELLAWFDQHVKGEE